MSFGWTVAFAGAAVLCFLLLGLALMDAETMLLPDAFTMPGLAAGVAFALFTPTQEPNAAFLRTSLRAGANSVLAALVAGGIILIIRWLYERLRGKEGMGLGDAKLLAMIGAWLGIQRTVLVLFLAVVAAALTGIALHLRERRATSSWLEARLPLGTFLAMAAIYSLFLGWSSIHWYLHFF